MSDLPTKADIRLCDWDVRLVPNANCEPTPTTRCLLLNHLVRAGEKQRRDSKVERLCRVEVYDKLERGWRLHREIGRFFPLENAIDVGRRALED